MPEIDQYSLNHAELIEMLVKRADIHDGQWSLAITFGIAIGKFGPDPDQTFPGAAVTIQKIGIQRVAPGSPTSGPGVVVVDAAKVNPAAKKRRA